MSNLPDTSLAAYRALQPEHLRTMYSKIIAALKVMGTGTYEELADYLNCREPNQISRRLKEMEGMQLIWKPGAKRLTKRNRQAYVYQLTEQPKTDAEVNQFKKGQQASTDYAQRLIQKEMQPELFPTQPQSLNTNY